MFGITDEVARSGARIAAAVHALSDTEVRAPSTLPGWSRGHVITHLALSADAYLRLLAVARTGAEPTPRADAAALARALQEGAGRPAAELAADLLSRIELLANDAASMPAERWDTLVTALAGWRHPAWYTLHRCRRELETHHVDLNVGYRTSNWPNTYVRWALGDTLAALTACDFPIARVDAVDLGRSWTLSPTGPTVTGSGHAILGWLSGRATDAPLSSDHPLPDPPNWPLPPAPAWT
ncbi:maleylpyruvate isomerase family mycothiol-dependent enzyme [Streptomyces narbonensis]|uniref:maleylpyruvate isomerase family mycothiol-dependent enzyme n=1 Tax=Streptomyces narbonensis TaxID=67333 RepID=UPI001671BB02|nr:maleylpyruvate isomerase family mycothiol-dependent enzyme [Streptomyces narbonensis]GGW05928.1 maleylpyruvate isomerase [Streptomyces narbonensis]